MDQQPQRATVAQERARYEAFAGSRPLHPGVTAEEATLGGRPAIRLRAGGTQDRTVLLYLHGGGYVIGSASTGAPLAAALIGRIGGTAYSLGYRLAPEHPFPAALEDAVAAYREIVAATDPGDVLLAGDSAGGGLAIALLVEAREAGLPQPAAVTVFSPWTDLTLSGESLRTRADADPIFTVDALRWYTEKYAAGSSPQASPIHADLSGLPPLLVQVGSDELLLDDAVRLAGRAGAAGTPVTLEVGAGLTHVYHHQFGELGAADEALDRAAAHLSRRLTAAPQG